MREPRSGRDGGHGDAAGGGDGRSPGKRPLVGELAPLRDQDGGASPPAALRQRVEAITGGDLSDARVHVGAQASAASEELGARGFTVGRDVFFRDGAYQPGTPAGDHLIAHELAHVVQQRGRAVAVQAKLEVSGRGDPSERAADRVAAAATSGRPLPRIQLRDVPAQIARDEGTAPAPAAEPPTAAEGWGREQDYGDGQGEAPAGGWDRRYGRSHSDGIRQEDWIRQHADGKSGYARLARASEQGGLALGAVEITTGDIDQIYAGARGRPGVTDAEVTEMAARAKSYLPQLNAAFDAMGLDTVQTQALFLAQASGETSMGASMVEQHAQKRAYAPFLGRGPLQVTNKEGYVRAIAYLEARSDQVAKELADKTKAKEALEAQLAAASAPPASSAEGAPPSPAPGVAELRAKLAAAKAEVERLGKQKALLDECATAVKADLRAAADPKYAFLFSAAYMQGQGGVRQANSLGATTVFDGVGGDEAWMTGGNQQADLDNPGKRRSFKFEEYRDQLRRHGKSTADMDSVIARGKVKAAVYAAAFAVFKAKATAAQAARKRQAIADDVAPAAAPAPSARKRDEDDPDEGD